jgi:hypothetical protein
MPQLRPIVWAITLTLASTAGLAANASAQTAYGPRIVHLSIVDRDTGQAKRVYLHDQRYFVAARTGHRYSLRIENLSPARVLVVLAVDGINVVSGETADFNQRGYILSPHQWADINGWRKSETEIAAFRFAPLSKSYAARTGRPSDVGVIGMAVFRERQAPPPVSMNEARRYAPAPPSAVRGDGSMAAPRERGAAGSADQALATRSERLGTAHGEIERDYSGVAPFERATRSPASVRMIEYDSVENLVAAGVIPPDVEEARRPRAFPADHSRDGYVPDPPPEGRD